MSIVNLNNNKDMVTQGKGGSIQSGCDDHRMEGLDQRMFLFLK